MAKGSVVYVACVGSTGSIVRDFNSKNVIEGSYRHTQTVNGVQYTWKCGALTLNGIVKLVEDEYEGKTFFRMEGIASNAAAVTTVVGALDEVSKCGW